MTSSWYDYDVYLQPKHLKGKRVTLTIARAGEVEVDERGNKQVKPVLYFKGTAKYLFLNKTSRTMLCEMFGESPAACAGKKIAIQAVPIKGRKDGKETVVISRAAETTPSASLPPDAVPQEKDDLARIWSLLEFHEIEQPEFVVKRAVTAAKGDHAVALAALEAKYGQVPVVVSS